MFKQFIQTALVLSVTVSPVYTIAGDDEARDQNQSDEKKIANFTFRKEIDIQKDRVPILGQVSSEGENIYMAMEKDFQKSLYVKKRNEETGNFKEAQKLKGPVNNSDYNVITASVTEDENTMVFVGSEDGTQQGNDLYIASRDGNGEKFADVRKLEEINTKGQSDMHPWISADGLRLYFTKQQGDQIHFYQASRTNPTEEFISLNKMDLEVPHVSNNVSCLFTDRETTAYIVSGNKIYRSDREDRNDSFGKPEKIAETNQSSYINGITMTADKRELYIFNSEGFKDIHLKKYINEDKREVPAVSR